jgi:flagellar biosynthetic protein FliP
MATNMTVPMVGWMWYRGHSRVALAQMAAAMYLPFVACFPLVWFGVLSATGLMIVGHVVMVPAMTLAMLWRLDEYTGHVHQRAHA